MNKHIFIFLFCLLVAHATKAQFGLHLQFLPEQGSAQYLQPAYIGSQEFQYVQVSTEGTFWIGSTSITLDGILDEGNYISNSAKNQILSQLEKKNNRLQAGASWGLHLNFKALKRVWQASFRQHTGFYTGINDSSTVGLVLRGNAPYAGQKLSDQNVFFRNMRYNEYALATAFSIGKGKLGIRAKLLQGRQATLIDDLSYTFFTAADGARIEVQSDYNIRKTISGGPNGWGAGVDVGLTYPINEKLSFQASLLNLGFINWQGQRTKSIVDFAYEGTEVDNILGDDLSSGNFFSMDTLLQLFFPDTIQSSFNTSLPTSLQIGFSYRLSEKERLHASLHQSFSKASPSTYVPLLNLAYHYELSPNFLVGANLYGGGIERYGLGLLASTDFIISEQIRIGIYAALDNALGGIIPSNARGLSMQGGISVGW